MKSIILPDYNSNVIRAMRSLEVKETSIPKPSGKQVLVKVAAAPCNPSDIAFMRGGYNIRKPVPTVMGFECSGTVVETGSDPLASKLLGKRVSCFTQGDEDGTWAEYFLTDESDCIPLREDMDMDQAAALCVNPFTAYALFLIARERESRSILHNAASGQIGRFIRTMARKEGIPVINIIRKDDHVEQLKEEEELYVLNMASPDFEEQLGKITHELGATVAFDAVAGELTGQMLNSMPPGSEVVVYGGLSGKPIGLINTLDVIFHGKTIRGFNLGEWKNEVGREVFLRVSEELQALFIEGFIKTRIQGTFPLTDVQAALEVYIRNMSAGKILLKA